MKKENERLLLPLIMDITNPSPALGVGNEERAGLFERGPTDLALALALVHHLAITHAVPFERIAYTMSRLCRILVIEFVPKSDPRVVALLCPREDIFVDYTMDAFERAFGEYFVLRRKDAINESDRMLYVMEKR